MATQECLDKLLLASSTKARMTNKKDLSTLLKMLYEDNDAANNILMLVENEKKKKHHSNMSGEEAVAACSLLGLSRNKYVDLRYITKFKHNCDLFPSKNVLLKAKKSVLPDDFEKILVLTNNDVYFPLQNIIDKTTEEIISTIPEDRMDKFIAESDDNELVLFCNWGMDGAGAQPFYSFKDNSYNTDEHSEGSAFTTSFLPVRLEDTSKNIIWKTFAVHSDQNCRPVRVQFKKETKELALNEHERVNTEIDNLRSLILQYKNCNISISFKFIEGALDGKILNWVCGNNCNQRCPFCGEMNTEFSNPKKSFTIKSDDLLKHGIAPLHCCIRTMECILKASYRLEYFNIFSVVI